jgi:predicted GIY-YIG superfamily endonuclease
MPHGRPSCRNRPEHPARLRSTFGRASSRQASLVRASYPPATRVSFTRSLSRRSGAAAKADHRLLTSLLTEIRKKLRTYSASFRIARSLARPHICVTAIMRGIGTRFVYVLRSDVNPARHYVGTTSDVDERLEWHNQGPCAHTVSHRPWSMVVSLEFPDEPSAVRFEKYLKSGSGRAFAKRHFGTA